MTQEDKELLFKDLCARLPYGVKIQVYFEDIAGSGYFDETVGLIDNDEPFHVNDRWIENITPYLRPMSSMTEEEKKKFKIISNCKVYKDDFDNDEDSEYFTYIDKLTEIETFDWLLKNHFDFMSLIPKGLAIEVTKENNPYEN